MRPVAVIQNQIRCPLNQLLGKEAHVRIIRVLVQNEESLSAKEISDRTELTHAGAHLALKRLLETGFVVATGGARGRRYTLRWSDPLLNSLTELFTAEESRYENLLESIRKIFYETSPPPISAWIASLPADIANPIEISILGDARTLTESVRNFRKRLLEIERLFDVTIELEGYTRADVPRIDSVVNLYLAGAPLVDETPQEPGGHHRKKDSQLMRASHFISERIRSDPTIVSRARRHLDRVLSKESGTARHDLEEWRDILDGYSLNRLCSFVNSTADRAVRLRQSSPFLAVLSDSEKAEFLGRTESR